jgi:hypothetical protein
MDFGIGELNSTKGTQKVIGESSMRRDDIQKKPLGYWISVAKGTHTTHELFYQNSSKYAFALQ